MKKSRGKFGCCPAPDAIDSLLTNDNSRKFQKSLIPKFKSHYCPQKKPSISRTDKVDFIKNIKEKIKQINWYKISNNWKIVHRKNQYSHYEIINLYPFKDCSKENPLYRKKEWLEWIYNDKELQLDDKSIGQICSINSSKIGTWRKKHEIPTKLRGKRRFVDKRSGRIYIRVPEDYDHPQLNNYKGRKKNYRLEHIYIMEKFLSNHPELEISKRCLIDGKYLRLECEVHHKNRNSKDNRKENLWVYENKKVHAEGELTLYEVLKDLINLNQILFKNGRYYINRCFDFRNLSSHEIRRILETFNTRKPINFKDLNLIRDEIQKIDWYGITDDWTVKESLNQFVKKITYVNPYLECAVENPLYKHKKWVETLIKEKRFNLTDSRLAKLCGVSRDTARYWREKVHKIEGKTNWGYDQYIDHSDGRIWRKVPHDYENPVVKKDDHQRKFMLEHRYIMERYLAAHPELEIAKKFLKDGKYLKSKCEVHHINLDCQDNRLENFWVFENSKEHHKAIKSLFNFVDELLKSKFIVFKKGKYYLNY